MTALLHWQWHCSTDEMHYQKMAGVMQTLAIFTGTFIAIPHAATCKIRNTVKPAVAHIPCACDYKLSLHKALYVAKRTASQGLNEELVMCSANDA